MGMGNGDKAPGATSTAPIRDVPVDWEALEDAFENNAPEVHSYLHLGTGEVLRVVDGIADPEMHARIAADTNYLRIDPVSSREQYRWMERFIQMLEDGELRDKLTSAIDGKGAFRRFKDVLMAHAAERERWFAFRSERLRVFMEAWLSAHALRPVARPVWPAPNGERPATSSSPPHANEASDANSAGEVDDAATRRARATDALRRQLRDVADTLGIRDLEKVTAFAEFIKARRSARAFAHRHEQLDAEADGPDSGSQPPDSDER